MSFRVFGIAFLFLLSACSSAPTNTESGEFKNATTIQGYFEQDSPLDWLQIKVLSVNGEQKEYGLFGGFGKTFVISPGESRVVAELRTNTGFGGACPCKRIEVFKLKVEPGHSYRVKAKLEGDNAKFWIEDLATSAPVTPIVNLRPRRY